MVEVMSKGAKGDIALPLNLRGIGENTLHMESQFTSQKDQGIMALSKVVMQENNPERTLPSLHQAIPEYRTRLPRDRESRPAEKLSNSPLGPPPSLPSPTPKKRRFSPCSGPGQIHTPDSARSPLDGQNVNSRSFPRYESSLSERSPISDRRRSGVSTSSSLSMVQSSHESPPLLPSLSVTSEETSPLDTEMLDRPNLPSIFDHAPKPSFHSPFDPKRPVLSSPYEISAHQSLSRYPHAHRDHRVLSSGSLPIYPPYPPRHPLSSDRLGFTADRSPFSSSGHHSDLELGMDYFEHSRGSKRRRGNLPKPVTDILRAWLHDHISHPYPTEEEKQALMIQTGLSISQISNWFINARRRRVPVIAKSAREDTDLNMTHQVLQRT